MIVPLVVLAWESDATVRLALEQSQAGELVGGGTSLMSGAAAELEAGARDPGAAYTFALGGGYQRVLAPEVMALGDSTGAPASDSVSSRLGGRAGWELSPRLSLDLDASGFLSSRLGVRADDELAARDPFAGDRVQYAAASGLGLGIVVTRRLTHRLAAGYLQEGALDAADPSAVGIDAHTGRASAGASWEMTPTDRLLPELRYTVTRFEHALLDVYRTRGPAEVHAATAALGVSHDFSRRLTGTVEGGGTVASPPPIVRGADVVVSPSVRAGVTWTNRPLRATARYAYEYTTLGPRIGYGHEHEGGLEVAFRPKDGARLRDFWVTAVARASYGTAPVAANPPLADGDLPPAPAEGTLTTWVAAVGARVIYPLGRGFAALGGVDLEHLVATFDPVPPTGDPPPSLRLVVTVGLGGALSTDPARALPNVPVEEEEGARSEAPSPSPRHDAPSPDDGGREAEEAARRARERDGGGVPSWP